MPDELSHGRSNILRHEARERELEPTSGDPALIEAVDDHLERFFGGGGAVFHELVSDRVHLDVHLVPATEERPWLTLMTSGMGERPMTVPEGLEDRRYAELMLALPPEWPLTDDAFTDENVYWPIRLLKDIARLPHHYETFLYLGHTIPNGDPPMPYAEATRLCGVLIGPPVLTPEGFERLEVSDGRVVHIYAVFVLHRDEMDFKLQQGAGALGDLLDAAGVTELVDTARDSTIPGKRGFFGRR